MQYVIIMYNIISNASKSLKASHNVDLSLIMNSSLLSL